MSNCRGTHAIHDLQLSQLTLNNFTSMSEPTEICKFDFSGKSPIPVDEQFKRKIAVSAVGKVNCVFFWWDLNMNPSGSILLSCGPHWTHPDTELLSNSQKEVVRQNAIPWRDHWMQGCFSLKEQSVSDVGVIYLTACHDEFSWWVDAQQDDNVDDDFFLERPTCTCLFHIVNSRNRIMQMNAFLRSPQLVPTSGNILFVGDCNLAVLRATQSFEERKVYVLQEDPLSFKIVKSFIQCNKLEQKAQLLSNLNEVPRSITNVQAEPHFNNSVLPWDNITKFYSTVKKLEKRQTEEFSVSPVAASIYALPVEYLNLHKIRWPLKSTVEGFDHQLFDHVIELASSLADDNVEPFSLWEYPCRASGEAKKIFEVNFMNEKLIETSTLTRTDVDIKKSCNGVALWVEWLVDDDNCRSCGPETSIIVGELIKWKMQHRQGVHLIPCSAIEKGEIESIDVKTSFDEKAEQIEMIFEYRYEKPQVNRTVL